VSRYLYKTTITIVLFVTGVGVAYLLGWLRNLYYYQTLGVEPYVAERGLAGTLLDSWFVLQNVGFFLLLWWVVVRLRIVWATLVGLLYSLLPIAAHYAFAFHENRVALGLIHYRHTLLKLLPFVLLVVAWRFYPKQRRSLVRLDWPYGRGGLVLCALIALAWSVSTAKHSGGFDANRALCWPETYLQRVVVEPRPGYRIPPQLVDNSDVFVIHLGQRDLVLWDRSRFEFRPGAAVQLYVVPRAAVQWIETREEFQVQTGRQFL
jgi:hypothetical protein